MLFQDEETGQKYPILNKYTSYVKKPEREIVGRTEEMRSIWASMMRPELCNIILLGEAGAGKALANDTLIPVLDDRGYVRISDLRVGDTVFDENGNPTQILGVYPQGKKKAYKVTLSDGTYVVCNNEHLWAARTRKQHYKNRPYQMVTLQHMMDYGIVRNLSHARVKSWYIPMARPVQRESVSLPIHPYVLGVLIGDGCLTERQLTISSSDELVVKRVADLIGASGYESTKANNYSWMFIRSDDKIGQTGIPLKYVQQSELKDLVDFDCVFYKKSIERRIPKQYLLGSVEQRFELLRGLMDTDGTVSGNDRVNCSLSTSSKDLADDFVVLVTSLGMRATVSKFDRSDTIHKNAEYEVHISCDDCMKPQLFWLEKHKQKFRDWHREDKRYHKHYDDIAIASVEELDYETDMTCIYVDSPSHLYQCTEHHIVTHNTMLVQGTMMKDKNRMYLEVNLSNMISTEGSESLPGMLENLFGEVMQFRQDKDKEIVLFIDEFHRIIQESPAAVEALKPLLADSGTRGIKIIAATTYIEFQQWISPNQPLVERLQRININQPDKQTTIEILKGMAKRYGVAEQLYNDYVYEMIYEYTNRYIPANSQPRKSILVLDNMVGWHRAEGRKLDIKLLADVIYEQEGINVAFRVDATKIKKELDANVLSQKFATAMIEQRLQICVADLNNKSKPMSSFLFTGSTGVGKSNVCSTIIPVYTKDGTISHKLAGDIEVGDYVFDREGNPTQVLGVFPQGKRDVYRVTLGDGRILDVSDNHLWAVHPAKRASDEGYTIYTTQTLINKGLETRHHDRVGMKYYIPMNQPVQWVEQNYEVDPYVIGALIGDGLLTEKNALLISSDDEFVVKKVANLIGAQSYKQEKEGYSWCFYTGNIVKGRHERIQLKDICGNISEIYMKKSPERRLPKKYMTGSIEQRWGLVHGLFDTDGSIGQCDGGRYNISYSTHSKGLAYDIQELLYSLGVSSSVTDYKRKPDENGYVKHEWNVHVMVKNQDKWRFFTLPRKLEIAKKSVGVNKQREKTFDYVGIRSIEKLDYKEDMVCFYVDNDEHLYQAGQYIVTHNTEMTKQLARILFEDDRRLIRFDMTEYANPDSLERFRQELTAKVWATPYSIVLLDEIEKACAPVTRVLLQVLDDGRLMDSNNREVVFTNCYIVLTTNAGSEIYKTISQYNVDDEGSGKEMKKYDKLIRASISGTTGDNRFPPELLGRIDTIVPFQPLSEETQKDIVKMKLQKLKEEVKQKHNVDLKIHKDVVRYLVEDNLDTDSNSGGARIIMSKLESEVTTAVARFINAHPNVATIGVVVIGKMAADNKTQLESEAYIKVLNA